MKEHQVIIVGAGPAGAACAKALKDEKLDVLVIEKEELPRPKICSGILFGQTQVLLEKHFGSLPPSGVYCEPKIVKACNIREWNKAKGFSEYVWEIPKDGIEFPKDYLNIWRSRFDQWLLEQSGADRRESCVLKDYADAGDKIKVTVLRKDKTRIESKNKEGAFQELCCDYLVGADGGNSSVRKIYDDSWAKEAAEVVIYQTYNRALVTGVLQDGHWNVFFEPDIGDILCCVHRKDDFLTLCVGGNKKRSLPQSMETFKRFLEDNFKVAFAEEERVEGCVMRMAPPDLGSGRVLLAGEAAGLIYLNGEGISAAIDSGYRAGTAIARAVKEGGDAAQRYRGTSADILSHMDACMQQMHFMTGQ